MGHKHTKDEILRGALDAAFDDGLSQLTFGRLAKRLGISDRVIVYYFPTKADLVGDVIVALGLELQSTLADAFSTPVADHLELMAAAWPVLTRPDTDRVFALFFEANGLASIGRDPYRTLVPALVDAWVAWAADHIVGSTEQQRIEAETAIALTDGLLLMRQLGGADAADRVARRIGIADPPPDASRSGYSSPSNAGG